MYRSTHVPITEDMPLLIYLPHVRCVVSWSEKSCYHAHVGLDVVGLNRQPRPRGSPLDGHVPEMRGFGSMGVPTSHRCTLGAPWLVTECLG